MAAPTEPVNLSERLSTFEDRWSPKIVAEANGWHVKLVKAAGEFVWHDHADVDELFLVLAGRLTIRRDGQPDAVLGPGEICVVPRGQRHQPVASDDCAMALLEPAGVPNTGAVTSELSAEDEWI